MAKNQSTHVNPKLLAADRVALAALKVIADYSPAQPAYKTSAIETALAELTAARDTEAQAQAALDTARDVTVAKEWAFHNLMLGAKDQVTAQFGRDSTQVQSVGRKRESERKKPQRKPKTT